MKRFEVGKKYIIGTVEYAEVVTVEVIARTAKFVTFRKNRDTKRIKVQNWDGREVAIWNDITVDAQEVTP